MCARSSATHWPADMAKPHERMSVILGSKNEVERVTAHPAKV